MTRKKRKKRKLPLFTNLAPHIYFYEKRLHILLALHSIYQKQKQNQFTLFCKYGPFSETHIFQKFPHLNNKNDDVSKYMRPF